MPAYVACPHCLHPLRWDRLKGHREWVCPRCKAKAEVREELRLEIDPKRRVPLWILWTIAVLAVTVTGIGLSRLLLK